MIAKGNNNIVNVYHGDQLITDVFKGTTLIHSLWEEKTLSGVPPLTIDSKGESLINYQINGDTFRDGTPDCETMVDYVCVGDLVTDPSNVNYGKYKIPIIINNVETDIYLDEPLRKGTISDYIDFTTGKVHRIMREYVITGRENWSKTSGKTGYRAYWRYTYSSSSIVGTTNSNAQVSNYCYYGAPTTSSSNTGIGIYNSSGKSYIRFRHPTSDSITEITEQWQELYDNGTPAKLVFQLANEDVENVVLPEILTNRGINTISVGTSLQPSNLEITYIGK